MSKTMKVVSWLFGCLFVFYFVSTAITDRDTFSRTISALSVSFSGMLGYIFGVGLVVGLLTLLQNAWWARRKGKR